MTDTIATQRLWPHAPPHWFVPNANYIITASTYQKLRLLNTPEKLDYLQASFFEEAAHFGWEVQAWAFMCNHNHAILKAPDNAKTLSWMLQALHSKTAEWLNDIDQSPGRKVWFQYRDTCLTYERSYLARLHYVHRNPQRHGVVKDAADYKWCSMRWFLENAKGSFQKTVLNFKTDTVNVWDDFD